MAKSFLLESGEVGGVGAKQMQLLREETVKKWDKFGFLKGLDGHVKDNVATLFENQATHLINEATTTDSSGSFETVVFPMVRRVFSKLIANDIVSVQALNLPIGRLFFFKPKISDRRQDGDTFRHAPPMFYPNVDNFGNNSDNEAVMAPFEERTLYDAFYEDQEDGGLFDRTKGAYEVICTGENEVPAATLQEWDGNELVEAQSWPDTDDTGIGTRYAIFCIEGFSSTSAGRLIGPKGNEMDTEEFLASLEIRNTTALSGCTRVDCQGDDECGPVELFPVGTKLDFRVVTQRYGRGIVDYGNDICDADGKLYVEVDFSVPACSDCVNVNGYVGICTQPEIMACWRRYEDLECDAEIAEVTFELCDVTVAVTGRKLRATWCPELAQDVSAFHNIDAEAELTAILSEQIAAEIDREILKDLRAGAAWTLRWDYDGWRRAAGVTTRYTQKEWNQTLITAINQISAQIHKATLRGGANWIVVSSEVSAIFDDLELFHVSNAGPEQDQYNMGMEKVGTMSGRYTVYRDPYAPANTILIGHKGSSLLDTGYVYAPYVPLQLTNVMYNPFNFAPIKGIMTRYAKKMVNNKFYGRIRVDGVRTFDVRELR